MFARILTQIVNWLGLPILLAIAVLLFKRKAQREYPYFFAYIVLVELAGMVRLLVLELVPKRYFGTFWVTNILIAVFGFLVSYELFARRLFPRFFTVALYRYLFPAIGIVLTLAAVLAALANRKISLLLALNHGLEILQVTVLVFFVALMQFMGRHWSRYEFGIALGRGVQASAELITSANWTRNAFIRHVTDQLPTFAFDVACIVWLVTFLKPEKTTAVPSGPLSPEVLTEARKWQEAAKGSVTGKTDPD